MLAQWPKESYKRFIGLFIKFVSVKIKENLFTSHNRALVYLKTIDKIESKTSKYKTRHRQKSTKKAKTNETLFANLNFL